MKALSAFALALLMSVAVGSASAADDHAKKIVGTWEVTKNESGDVPVGGTAEFTKDGKLIVAGKKDGKEVKAEGTYKIEKDKLLTKFTVNGKDIEETDEIVK